MKLAPETVLRGHIGDVQCLEFAVQDTVLLSGDSFGSVRVWNIDSARSNETKAHNEDAGVSQVCVVNDTVITQGRDGGVKRWALGDHGSLLADHEVLPTGSYHFCKCAVPSASQRGISSLMGHGVVAVAGEDNKGVRVVDSRSSEQCLHVGGSSQCGMTMCIELPDMTEPMLLVGTESGHVVCWDARNTAQEISSLRCGEEPVLSLSARLHCTPPSPSCTTKTTGTNRPEPAGRTEGTCPQKNISYGDYAYDSSSQGENVGADNSSLSIVAGSAGLQLHWLNFGASGQITFRRKVNLPEEGVGDVCVRQDGRIVAVGCWDAGVRLFHMRTGKHLAVLKQHRASITSVKFGHKGVIACASRDKTVSLWDVYT